MKRKPKYTGIPGIGAAKSSHLRKVWRWERLSMADTFIAYAEHAMDSSGDEWTKDKFVQATRADYNAACMRDCWRPIG